MTLTCILVDLENVQLKAPDLAGLRRGEHLLKIFHGPSQNSFTAAMVRALQPLGDAVEYIQCEKAGPNALDFHLAFHLGRLTASQPALDYRIVSRDKGFAQLVAHATRLGHRVSQHAALQWPGLFGAAVTTVPAAPGGVAPKPERAARAVATKKVAAKAVDIKPVETKAAPASKKVAPVKTPRAAAKAGAGVAAAPAAPVAPAAKKAPGRKAAAKKGAAVKPAASAVTQAKAGPRDVATAADQHKALASLRKLGGKLPGKRPALEHYLESHLRNDLTPAGVQALVQWLMASGVLQMVGGKLSYQLPG